MAGFVSFIFFVIFNFTIVIPCAFFIFYTAQSVFPVLAAVEDLDAPIYQSLDLGGVVDEADRPSRLDKDDSKPRPVSSSIRAMTRLLYSRRKFLSFFRGYGWFFLFSAVKGAALLLAIWAPVLGFFVQVLLPLAATHFHTLWVHSVISSSSSLSFRSLLATRDIYKTAGPPMLLYLTAETTTQRIMLQYYKATSMRWEDFMPIGGHWHKSFVFWVLLIVLSFFLVVPPYLLLVRTEASLFPAGENSVVPLDPALSEDIAQSGLLAVVSAWRSLTRSRVVNMVFLSFRIFAITAAVVTVIGFPDFFWYFMIAMANWRF